MFCQNCGKEIENSTKFCPECGAPQEAFSQQSVQPTEENFERPDTQNYQNTQSDNSVPQGAVPYYSAPVTQPITKKKGNKGCLIAAIIAIAVFILVVVGVVLVAVFSYDVINDIVSDTNTDDAYVSEYADNALTDLTYEEIFSTYNVIDTPAFFTTKESCAFAYVDTDGYIEKSEYGYEGDVIFEMVDTYYYPISEYTKEEKDAYLTLTKEEFSADDALECCTVSYNMTNDYCIVTLKYTDVDKPQTIKELQEIGLIESDFGIEYLSMEENEKVYLEMGFVKK